jgi:hypothetical protein
MLVASRSIGDDARVNRVRFVLVGACIASALLVGGCSSPARQSAPSAASKVPPPPLPDARSAVPAVASGQDGYTTFAASPDSRIVYVSSSQGRDTNSGLSPDAPKASLDAGLAELRSHHPDRLLLKRGDVWNAPRGFMIDKSGRSMVAPLVISAYGEGPRPEVRGNVRLGTGYREAHGLHHVALKSIHIHLNHRDPRDPTFNPSGDGNGLYIGEGGESKAPIAIEDVLIEDVLVNFGGVVVQSELGAGGEHRVRNVRFRRTVVKDAYEDSRASGIFVHGVDGLLVEECAIDNVQQRQVPAAEPTGQDHSIYVQSTVRNAVIRRSLFTRVPDGPMMRSGGVFEDNVVARAVWCGNLHGLISGGTDPVEGGVSSRVTGNAFLETDGPALVLGNMARGEVADNLFLGPSTRQRGAIELHPRTTVPEGFQRANAGVHNVELRNNVVRGYAKALWVIEDGALSNLRVQGNTFVASGSASLIESVMPLGPERARFAGNRYHAGGTGWFRLLDRGIDAQDWPGESGETGAAFDAIAFVDARRDLATYNASLGGPASLEAFVREVHAQAQGHYRDAYTAQAVLRYLRAGLQRK